MCKPVYLCQQSMITDITQPCVNMHR